MPVVIAAISSANGSDNVTGRMQNITTQDFEFLIQEQELNSLFHITENISYTVWEPSSGNIDRLTFEINKTEDVVTHGFNEVTFNQAFGTGPKFLADIMQATLNHLYKRKNNKCSNV